MGRIELGEISSLIGPFFSLTQLKYFVVYLKHISTTANYFALKVQMCTCTCIWILCILAFEQPLS